MDAIIITANLVSAYFLLIILIGDYYTDIKREAVSSSYTICVLATLIALILEALAYVTRGEPLGDGVLLALNTGAYLIRDVLFVSFAYYCVNLIRTSYPVSKWWARAVVIVECVDAAMIINGSMRGTMFTIEDNVVRQSVGANLALYTQLICFVVLLALIIRVRKQIQLSYGIALISYMLLPFADVLIEIFYPELSFPYVACALSLTILHVIVQNSRIREGNLREKILDEVSNLDVLTGLKNRRAFIKVLEEVGGESGLGILFCDVNGLKTTNDNQGHAAGDELLKRFAQMLKDRFGDAYVFRMSGDEFAVLFPGEKKAAFAEQAQRFRTICANSGEIASVGDAYGTGQDAMELLKQAEIVMYQEKRSHYQRIGVDRRAERR